MKTVSSHNSLLLWQHNLNGSGIAVSCIGGDALFLKPFYADLFRRVSALLKEKVRTSFSAVWISECDRSCNDVRKAISGCGKFDDSDIELVVNKFRGNCGEILVEMLAVNGLLDFIEIGSYSPVDPEHEQFIDAEAVRNGLPVGIQVKNYSAGNLISQEIFTKAAAMSDLWLRHDKRITDENVIDFLKSPCQYVISATDVKSEMIAERYAGSVVFFGPKWLDAKRIQGSVSTGENAKWSMFLKVADEVNSF